MNLPKESNMSGPLTIEDLRKCRLQRVLFLDGAKGMAVQVSRCVEHPALTVHRSRAPGSSKWDTIYAVNGEEVTDLPSAVAALNALGNEE